MKIRNGFVSNSSSSSFVVCKKHLTAKQLEQIKQHYSMSREWLQALGDEIREYDQWTVTETAKFIIGATDMDNFDMTAWLQHIDIDLDLVTFDDYRVYEQALLDEGRIP